MSLKAISPIDGRYESKTRNLQEYFSEYALIKRRTEVEIKYLIALSNLKGFPLELSKEEKEEIKKLYESFEEEDARLVKRMEIKGWKEKNIPATNHDVKAVEYFIRENIPERVSEFIHFGLTSEDVNNLAYSLMVKQSLKEEIFPAIKNIGNKLLDLSESYKSLPMLGFTHGQKATPTTLGKEFSVYLNRLGSQFLDLKKLYKEIKGKLAGATGGLNAHKEAFPEINWINFSEEFVSSLHLKPVYPTTQIKPRDDFADLLNKLKNINNILIDLDIDMWLYISRGYLNQKIKSGEVGSSTMPHKVNPINFENSEGNLSIANSNFDFLTSYITRSRMQRDLSDSTVMRNIGVSLAHSLIGYKNSLKGLNKIEPSDKIEEELENTPEILTEAIQTVLRSKGVKDAYEKVKDMSRKKKFSIKNLSLLLEKLDIDPDTLDALEKLKPTDYIGYSKELVDKSLKRNKKIFGN